METLEKIKLGENRFVEFKETLPKSDSFAKTVIAFSNGSGGEIFIGVKDNKEIIGVNDKDLLDIPDKVSDIVYSLCYPTIIVDRYSEKVEDKNIVVVKVFPGGLKPYFLKSKSKIDGTYVRVGAENKLADNEFLLELERYRRNIGFDEEINYNYLLESLNYDFLKSIFKSKKNREIEFNDLINLKLVKEENGKYYPTNAFLILAGVLENTYTDCARFKGVTVSSFIDKKEFKSDLFSQIESIEQFIKNHLNLNAEIDGFIRKEKYEIPMEALREAVLNAFIHRDYNRSGSNTKIAIFDDILEITNPGVLPAAINIDEMFTSKRSEVRNKIIARIFKEIGYIEQWGTGMGRIAEYCKSSKLRIPSVRESGNFFQIVFYRAEEVHSDKTPINTDKTPINTDKIDFSTSENELKIIEYLKTNKSITNKIAREITGLTDDGVKTAFHRLISKGIIEKVGERKMTHYVLIEK